MPKGKRTVAPEEIDPEMEEENAVKQLDEGRPAKRVKKGKKPQRSDDEQPFENGVLRALVLENFMNHAHLRVDFDPHVNFIVGRNGSGKSAIVNALIAGFGHRASSTGRNTNTSKSLIMNGAEYALIQVHLANGGEDPFKPEEFGDTIVAEHRLEKQGTGSYRLRNGLDGASRKSSRSEFTELSSHFNIQANNPCALLTQEHAKKFLHQGNEEDRYRFFLQAANLETRKADLNQTHQNVALLSDKLEAAKLGMVEKEEFARRCQAEFEGAKKLKEIQKQVDEFEPLLGWAMVAQKERELEAHKQTADAAESKVKEDEAICSSANDSRISLEEELAAKERESIEARKKLDDFGKRAERMRAQAMVARKESKKAKKEVEEIEDMLMGEQQNLVNTKHEYDQAFSALEGSEHAASVQHAQHVRQVSEEASRFEGAIGQYKAEVTRALGEYQTAIDSNRELQATLKERQEELKLKEGELSTLQKGEFDREKALHPQMAELRKLIAREKRFSSPPIGPVALLINVKKEHEKLTQVVEAAIGHANLLGFIVATNADEVLLRSIMGKMSPPANGSKKLPLSKLVRCFIIPVQPRHKIGTEGRRPAPTLVDALDFQSETHEADQVFNFLCDFAAAESKMLFDDRDKAQRVVYSSADKAAQALSYANGDTMSWKVFKKGDATGFEYAAAPRGWLVADKAAAISQLKAEVEACRVEVGRVQKNASEADTLRKRLQGAEVSARKALKEATSKLERLKDELAQLDSESPTDSVQALENPWNF